MRHTPGPWTIKCIGGQGFKIKEWNGSAKEDSANAQLIASAPELFDALKYMNHVDDGYCICPLGNGLADDAKHATSCTDARKAIAKAERGI